MEKEEYTIIKSFLEHKKLDYNIPLNDGIIYITTKITFSMNCNVMNMEDISTNYILLFNTANNRFDIDENNLSEKLFKYLQTDYEIFERKYKIEKLLN